MCPQVSNPHKALKLRMFMTTNSKEHYLNHVLCSLFNIQIYLRNQILIFFLNEWSCWDNFRSARECSRKVKCLL